MPTIGGVQGLVVTENGSEPLKLPVCTSVTPVSKVESIEASTVQVPPAAGRTPLTLVLMVTVSWTDEPTAIGPSGLSKVTVVVGIH